MVALVWYQDELGGAESWDVYQSQIVPMDFGTDIAPTRSLIFILQGE